MAKDLTTPYISRRETLVTLASFTLAMSSMADSNKEKDSQQCNTLKGIALQLYTVREPAKKDLGATLRKVREIGWEYVQWSGMPDLPPESIRSALDEAGLKAIAAHVSIEAFERDFDNHVAFWKTVGAPDVAPGGMMNDCRGSLDAWLQGAKRLDRLGAQLRQVGMRLSYHNHDWEFQRFDEDPRTKFDILYEETSAENLFAEIDVAWVHAGGENPADCMRRYANRCPLIHAKDLTEKRFLGKRIQFVPLGQGILDWDGIFQAGKEAGVEWYIYEQDNAEKDIFECAAESYEFLKTKLNV